jgi:hypothetical protein
MVKNKRLTLEDRQKIEGLLHSNFNHKKICELVGIHTSTLYREFKKCKDSYNAKEAHANTCRGYKAIDFKIIGKKFGLLTVKNYVHKYNRRTYWKCKCDCGAFTIISRKILADYCSPDRPLSCGCIAKEHQGPKKGSIDLEESSLRKYQDLLAFREKQGECWIYTGYLQGGKIPKTSWRNKAMSVRKCMYLLIHGTTYEPNHTYASCKNRLCFNPDHIVLGRPPNRYWYE